MMKSNQTIYIFLAFIGILMWNGFLIQRDNKMFEGYDKMNAKERACAELKTFHPDCKVE